MALPTKHELVSLQSLTGTVLHDDGEGVYRLPFEAWIGGRPRTVTAVLQRTVVYLVPELEDRRLALFGDVLVDLQSLRRPLPRLAREPTATWADDSRTCAMCARDFEPRYWNQRLCGDPCSRGLERAEQPPIKSRICQGCGADFTPTKYTQGQLFCNRRCQKRDSNRRARVSRGS